jgi:hypothetical protein
MLMVSGTLIYLSHYAIVITGLKQVNIEHNIYYLLVTFKFPDSSLNFDKCIYLFICFFNDFIRGSHYIGSNTSIIRPTKYI